jgi:hypothetical protein
MERSEIRETANAEVLIPDCAALHPGYKLPIQISNSQAFSFSRRRASWVFS